MMCTVLCSHVITPFFVIIADFDGNAQSSFNFVTSSEAITTEYDVGSLVIDDDSLEQEEGFVLYFDFDQSQISIDDYSRLQTGTRAILVTITDNDACKRIYQSLYSLYI